MERDEAAETWRGGDEEAEAKCRSMQLPEEATDLRTPKHVPEVKQGQHTEPELIGEIFHAPRASMSVTRRAQLSRKFCSDYTPSDTTRNEASMEREEPDAGVTSVDGD
jgi:hypothetical protein